MKNSIQFLIFLTILTLQSCQKDPTFIPPIPAGTSIFAVIGDYGDNSDAEKDVANMVKNWQPDFIITTGDNNYNNGEWSTIKNNISQYYSDYIYNPDAPENFRCEGSAANDLQNRFFPSPGNHDYLTDNLAPYLDFFTLPHNERYYNFRRGSVHFFSLDSNLASEFEDMKLWLEETIANSDATFKVVYFHHPPFSSSKHGNNIEMQWDFAELGVDVVLSGHEHVYQHITKKESPDVHYFVNGLGGRTNRYRCSENPLDSNEFDSFCYRKKNGAMRVTATDEVMILGFYSTQSGGILIDEVVIRK